MPKLTTSEQTYVNRVIDWTLRTYGKSALFEITEDPEQMAKYMNLYNQSFEIFAEKVKSSIPLRHQIAGMVYDEFTKENGK